MSIWGYRSMYNEMINSAFGAEDFHLSVFKQEDGWKRRYSGELEQCDFETQEYEVLSYLCRMASN